LYFFTISLILQIQHLRPNDPYPTDSMEKEELDKVMFYQFTYTSYTSE